MKIRIFSIVGLAIAAMLTSCLSEPDFEPVPQGGIPINLDGSVNQIPTKVNAQGFEDGDGLGLYAVNYENANQIPGTLKDEGNQVDHVKYVFDEKNWKWTPVRPVYYKDVNTNVDLYAFYPFAEPSSVSAYNFEVQKDQSTARSNGKLAGYEASDFLWGKAENVVPTESAIKVKLNHMMAGAHVILKEGTGFEEAGDFALIDKKVLVTNTTRKASIDLSNGKVTPIGGAQATGIVMAPQSDGSFRAIIVPQIVEAGSSLFNITVEGKAYTFAKDAAYEYVAGKLSQFTITINRKLPSGEYELVLDDIQIIDWKEDINTHEGEARQYYCVHCEEPETLGKLIKADKKNPDKIKNLKVSGKISDEDFYFMRDSMAILEAVNLKESKVVDVYLPKEWGTLPNGEYGIIADARTIDDVIPCSAFENKKSLYYFDFPEQVTEIGASAFENSSLSGALIIPDNVKILSNNAFSYTNISSINLSNNVTYIGGSCFAHSKTLSGNLSFSNKLKYIGDDSFRDCSFNGKLNLPNSLEYLGRGAFMDAGAFIGDITIPEKIHTIKKNTFENSDIANPKGICGNLNLNNVTCIEVGAFAGNKIQGEIIIPEGVTDIESRAFDYCPMITSIVFPSTLKVIKEYAFRSCSRLGGNVSFPEGLIAIQAYAFDGGAIESLEFPSTLQSIGTRAFANQYDIYSITSRSTEPPTVQEQAFDGVPKDNFAVEVPENSVSRYKADPQWGEFRRISAHHDFSISRPLARSLNAETSKTYILRAPSGFDWSIESKPDWITVTPSSGTGKTEINITFSEMLSSDMSIIEGEMDYTQAGPPTTKYYNGRSGEIVFLLNDKDYRSRMTVEQYDYEYGDGDVHILQEATKGNGVNLVFLADCYDAKDIATGNYLKDVQEAYGYYFDVEPYKTYKEYFNVYTVFGESDDSGIGTVNTVRDAKFGSQYSLEGISPDFGVCYEYAKKADSGINPSQTLIVMVENTTEYGGKCYMWGDGSAVACCPKSADAYPYDFRGIVQHEAGGHGFGKLADEYIYANAFIGNCGCLNPHLEQFLLGKSLGWYRNLEVIGDIHQVGWSHMIFHPQYSNVVDVYEGGYFHSRGVYRSEPTSCMNNNIPYYSAISRQAIVERIMDYAGETFVLEDFYAKDSDEFGSTKTKSLMDTMPIAPFYDNGKQFAPKYMGDKPDFLK